MCPISHIVLLIARFFGANEGKGEGHIARFVGANYHPIEKSYGLRHHFFPIEGIVRVALF